MKYGKSFKFEVISLSDEIGVKKQPTSSESHITRSMTGVKAVIVIINRLLLAAEKI